MPEVHKDFRCIKTLKAKVNWSIVVQENRCKFLRSGTYVLGTDHRSMAEVQSRARFIFLFLFYEALDSLLSRKLQKKVGNIIQ